MLKANNGQKAQDTGSSVEAESLYFSSEDETASHASDRSGNLQDIFSYLTIGMSTKLSASVLLSNGIESPNFLEEQFRIPDLPENLALDDEGNILAATCFKLVEKLTTLVDDFLLVYRKFLSSSQLAELLSFRLKQSFLGNLCDGERQNLKVRVFVAIRQWTRDYYEVDFVEEGVRSPLINVIEEVRQEQKNLTVADQQILLKLSKFLTRDIQTSNDSSVNSRDSEEISLVSRGFNTITELDPTAKRLSWTKRLSERIRKIVKGVNNDDSSSISLSVDTSILTDSKLPTDAIQSASVLRNMTLEDIKQRYERHSCLAMEPTQAVAENLSLIEKKLFHSLSWSEMLKYPSEDIECHGIRSCVDHFNQMCQWIISEILCCHSHQEQSVIIKKLLRIAIKCLGHCNFNSVMQIMLALQSPPIEQLTPVWSKMSEYEKGIFDDLVTFASPARNFRNLRKAMELQELTNNPCVPFTGLFLADLSSNDERTGEERNENLIPWFKYQTIAKLIKQFRSFQSSDRKYKFLSRPDLYRYLLHCCNQIKLDQAS